MVAKQILRRWKYRNGKRRCKLLLGMSSSFVQGFIGFGTPIFVRKAKKYVIPYQKGHHLETVTKFDYSRSRILLVGSLIFLLIYRYISKLGARFVSSRTIRDMRENAFKMLLTDGYWDPECNWTFQRVVSTEIKPVRNVNVCYKCKRWGKNSLESLE